eukprot:2023568-Pyramimonas_sp.AAC.1
MRTSARVASQAQPRHDGGMSRRLLDTRVPPLVAVGRKAGGAAEYMSSNGPPRTTPPDTRKRCGAGPTSSPLKQQASWDGQTYPPPQPQSRSGALDRRLALPRNSEGI